jgi:zinc transporter 1
MDGHGHSHSPRLFSREVRIGCMLLLTGSFFFVEIVVGYLTHSLALIADSFHMLSDVIALIIAITAIRMAKRPASEKNTYGWQRAELLGALVNSVFLLAMCLSIFIEAVQRFFDPHLEVWNHIRPSDVVWHQCGTSSN